MILTRPLPRRDQIKIPPNRFDPVSPDSLFIASNYCCRRLLLPQLSLSPVLLARGVSTWWPPPQFEVSSSVGIVGEGGRDSFAKGGERRNRGRAWGHFHIYYVLVPFSNIGFVCVVFSYFGLCVLFCCFGYLNKQALYKP